MSERSGDGWSGYVGGLQPVQGEGTVDDHPWYFRAKYDQWSFWVADRAEMDAAGVGVDEPGWMTDGDAFNAGHMDDWQAWGLIEYGIAAFRAGKLERVEAKK